MMGDDGRRAYGLGSFFKSITKPFKKAFRGFKKIAKSPLGKMALMYFGGNMLQGNFAGSNPFTGGFKNPLKGNVTNSISNMFSGMGGNTASSGPSYKGMDSIGSGKVQQIASEVKDINKGGNFLSKSLGYMKDNPFATIVGTSALSGAYTAYLNNKKQNESMEEYNRRLEEERGNFAAIPTEFAQFAADGGRMGYDRGGIADMRRAALNKIYEMEEEEFSGGGLAGNPPVTLAPSGQNSQSFSDDESKGMNQGPTMQSQMPIQKPMMDPRMMQQMKPQMDPRMMAAMGGLMNMGGRMGYAEGGESEELLDMGGLEKDYRNDGGFVPMGEYERKDDVPARLSKNEFVFTADAVRNAGGGDIDKGAEIMENMMKNLENGGQVSQGSQGLEGAREMFQTQQRLGEVL